MFYFINLVNDFEGVAVPNDETQQMLEFYRFGFYVLLLISLLLIVYIILNKNHNK